MTYDRNALKAGIFILISIGLMIGVIIGIKGVGRFLEPMQHASAMFKIDDDIGGLSPGDEVRIGGAKVGVVRRVDFVEAGGEKQSIVVSFTMPKRFPLHKDALVVVQSTVTGVSVLNFSSLGSGDLLGPDDLLEGRPGALAALLGSGTDFAAIARDFHTVTLPKVNAMTDTAKAALEQIRDLFGDTKVDFRVTVANLRDATGTMKDKLPGVMDKADTLIAKVTTAIDNTTVTLEDLKKVAANTRDITASARGIVTGNRGKFDAMIASLKTTGDNLKNASAEIRRSPWRLLYKPGPGEMANLNLYDSARQFAEGAGQLNDAAIALRDAVKNPDVDQVQVQKMVDRLDKQFTSFNEVEQQLWTQVKQ